MRVYSEKLRVARLLLEKVNRVPAFGRRIFADGGHQSQGMIRVRSSSEAQLRAARPRRPDSLYARWAPKAAFCLDKQQRIVT